MSKADSTPSTNVLPFPGPDGGKRELIRLYTGTDDLGRRLTAATATALRKVPPAGTPNAALIGACLVFDAMEGETRRLHATIRDDDRRDQGIRQVDAAQALFLRKIVALRAATTAGHLARACTIARWAGGAVFDGLDSGYWDQALLASLVRDLVAEPPPEGALPEGA